MMRTTKTAIGVVAALVVITSGVAALQPASAASTTPEGSAPAASASQPGSAGGQLPADQVDTSAWTAGGLISTGTQPAQAVASSTGFVSVGGCTFYASSSSAGGYCSSGVKGGHIVTLAEYLAGRPFVMCRYFPIPEGMYLNAPEQPGGEWLLKACFEDVDLQQPWGGTGVGVEVYQQFVPDGEVPGLPGYMETFWNFQADRNYYPIPRISVGPTNPARVGAYTYFWTTWIEALDDRAETQPSYLIPYATGEGRVFLHAAVARVVIDPGGGLDTIDCGVAEVKFDETATDTIPSSEGGAQPSDCWAQYTHSSATSDDDTVPVLATAYWRVNVERGDGSVRAGLGEFNYETNQRIAIAEIQTLTEW